MASIVCSYRNDLLSPICLAFSNDPLPFVTHGADCIMDFCVVWVYELSDILLTKDCHRLSSKLETFNISKGFRDVHILFKSGI